MDGVLLNQKEACVDGAGGAGGDLFGNGLGFSSSSFARLIDLWTTAARR